MSGKAKKIFIIFILVILAGSLSFALRGPYISNYLKKMVLREVQSATGRQVIAQRFFVNLFPPFVGASDIKIFDEEGKRLLTVKSIKTYIGLSNILRKEVDIKRLYIEAPEIWLDNATVADIEFNLQRYRSKKSDTGLKINLKILEIKNLSFSYYEKDSQSLNTGKGIDVTLNMRENPEIDFNSEELTASYKDMPELRGAVSGLVVLKPHEFDVRRLRLASFGSIVNSAGYYKTEGNGRFETETSILVATVKKIFGLKKKGDGKINAKGTVEIKDDIKNPIIDLSVGGNFYLETLMELLNAGTDMSLRGLVSFKGKLSGRLTDLKGEATARLRKGAIFDILLDDLKCKIAYSKGVLSFTDGIAALYGGKGFAEAEIKIPDITPYTVSVTVADVQSSGILKLIELELPGFPEGKVSGGLRTEADEFDPKGWFTYRSGGIVNSSLGRIIDAGGGFTVLGNQVSIEDLNLSTGLTNAVVNGMVNTDSEEIFMSGIINSADIRDITLPYFDKLHGTAQIDAVVTGTYESPHVEAILKGADVWLDDYILGSIDGKVAYTKDMLDVLDIKALHRGVYHSLSGGISFPSAKELFEFGHPVFDLKISAMNSPVEDILKLLALPAPVKATADSEITVKGETPVIAGSAHISNASAYGFSLESADMDFMYDMTEFEVKKAVAKKGESRLYLAGSINNSGGFDFDARSKEIYLRDFTSKDFPLDYKISIDSKGMGNLKNPLISFTAGLTNGVLYGNRIEDGTIDVSIKERNYIFMAKLLGDIISLKGSGTINEEMPWSADLTMNQGRYDYFLKPLSNKLPEEFTLGLDGKASLKGSKKHIHADVRLKHLNAFIFNQEVFNDTDINFVVDDKKVRFSSFSLRSGDASMMVEGGVEAGKGYDLSMHGNLSLSSLKMVSDKIDVLKGQATYVLSVQGDWSKPSFNGGFDISNGSVSLKGFPQRLTSIHGYVYADENKIVIQELDGRLGGGNVNLTGAVYIDGYAITKYYADAILNNVTLSIMKNFNANVEGNILIRGTPESRKVNGELRINRARLTEKIEWKTWLLTGKKTQSVRPEPWMDKTVLNLKVYGADNIMVDNNIARTFLKVDMIVKGTLAHPVLFGRIEAREGKVYFRNNVFSIMSATADFTDPVKISPHFGITAETFIGGYHIWLGLEGQMDRFNLTLSSDPPLDEVEILSLLTLGKFGTRLSGLESGIGASEAASFLTGRYQDVIEERVRDITGLDRIQVAPYVSKATGSVVPRITVSKKLFGDMLYVTYASSVGTSEEQVLKLEYFLSNNMSLVGERDERGSLGGDIKFRFKFK